MTRIWPTLLSAAAFLTIGFGAQGAPLAAYGHLPLIENLQISPDGTKLAMAVTDGENRRVVVESLASQALIGGVNFGDAKFRDLQWAGPDHLLLTTSTTAYARGVEGSRQEYYMTVDYDLSRNKQFRLMENMDKAMNVAVGDPQVRIIDGRPVAFIPGIYFAEHVGQIALFRIDLQTHQTRRVQDGFADTRDWMVDAKGEAVAETEYVERTGRWTLKTRNKSGWTSRRVLDAPTEQPALMGLGRDGTSVLLGTLDDDDRLQLEEFDPDDSGKSQSLPPQEFSSSLHDPADHRLIGGVSQVGDELRYTFFSPKDQAIWKGVQKAFPGERVSLASWSDDRRKIIVKVDGELDGFTYALVDMDTKQASWIGEVYSDIKPADIAPMQPIKYKAQDGLEITGYLTTPRGRDAKNLPLIVMPHGGPAIRDEPGFDWWAQALASRGYAVLQPNFRGSSGFGWKFLSAGFGEWGRKMQTDLSDGVRDLAAKGVIDPKRVCIAGGSYGGYAALAGATIDTGVYRCAVSVSGPADLKQMLIWERGYQNSDNSSLRYWTRFMGVEGIKDPNLADISPASHADKVTIPLLLIHGKDDTVVPYEQSQFMARAMAKAGKPVEFVTLPGEDHHLSRGATRLQMLTALVAFLEKNNPPG